MDISSVVSILVLFFSSTHGLPQTTEWGVEIESRTETSKLALVTPKFLEGFYKFETKKKIINDFDLDKKEVECLLYDKKCTKQFTKIKGTILKALRDGCTDCVDEEKREAGKVVGILLFKRPLLWRAFLKNHDVDGKFGKMHLS